MHNRRIGIAAGLAALLGFGGIAAAQGSTPIRIMDYGAAHRPRPNSRAQQRRDSMPAGWSIRLPSQKRTTVAAMKRAAKKRRFVRARSSKRKAA